MQTKKFSQFLKRDPRALTLMAVPALVLFVIFVLVPIIMGLHISFTDWNGYSQKYSFVGLENYREMIHDESVGIAFRNTIVYGFGSTLIQIILGLSLALLLAKKFLFRTITRTLVYIPAMVAQLVVGYIWYFIVSYERGALNDVLKLFGAQPVDWLAKGTRAVLIITLINSIEYCGKAMVIFIAGLQAIPGMYTEAAAIDGANGWQVFRHITIPMLLPAFTSAIVLNVIGGLKMFGLVLSLTDGGPGYASHSLSSLINTMYFANQQAGYSAAIGVFSFLFIMAVSILMRRCLAAKEKQYNG